MANYKKRNTNRGNKSRPTSNPRNRKNNSDTDNRSDSKYPSYSGSCNDPEWYNVHPDLVRDTGSIYFNRILGSKFHDWRNAWAPEGKHVYAYNNDDQFGINAKALPGYATIMYVAGPGISTDSNSAINKAAQDIYSRIRFENSGSKVYDSVDLMQYLLAMDEVIQWWGTLQRIYGLVMSFSPINNYTPMYMVSSLGFDFNDLESNITQLRAHINTLVRKIARRYIPANLNIFKRHYWMSQNMYLDSLNDVAQRYMFKPYGYRVWDEANDQLKFTAFPNNRELTLSDIKTITDRIVEPILASEDFGIMSGDILKVYGSNGIMTYSVMPEDYVAPVVYDESVLSMIENAMIYNVENFDITTNVGSVSENSHIIYEPKYTIPQNTVWMAALDPVMNFHHSDPPPLEVMYSSRFMTTFDKTGLADTTDVDTRKLFPITSCGAELLISMSMWTFAWDNNDLLLRRDIIKSWYMQSTTQSKVDYFSWALGYSNYDAFNYAPRMVLGAYSDDQRTNVCVLRDTCKYDVATHLSDDSIKSLNDTAMLSLWDFPFKNVGPKS